jgi:PhnB protein
MLDIVARNVRGPLKGAAALQTAKVAFPLGLRRQLGIRRAQRAISAVLPKRRCVMAQAKAIPDGYRTVTPFLNVKGATEAIEFYKSAFGAKERSRMPGPGGVVMHAELEFGDSIVMLSDVMQNTPTASAIHLYVTDADALFARATKAGCQVMMPLQDMFWGDRYGIVLDKWGNRWSIATHKEDVPPGEMQTRMQAQMAAKK